MGLPVRGEVIAGKYRIEGTLGEGGMAHVLAAHHELLDKPVAVKILSPLAPQAASFGVFVVRFLTEARASARIDSPHVARVMDVGTLDDGVPYMVMERLDGCDLEEMLGLEKRLAVSDAVDYVLQALAGLAQAHALGIVHRDLKPANLFLAKQPDGSAHIKVVDFGIAKLAATAGKNAGRVTGEGSAVGSPMYMSPEQVRDAKSVDHRADIWAMGIVLYELVVGDVPFAAEGVGEIFAAVLEQKIVPPGKRQLDVPAGLDAAIMGCLHRDPRKRYANVGALARAIAPFGSGRWLPLVDGIEEACRRQLGRGPRHVDIIPSSIRAPTETTATLEASAPPEPKRSRGRLWAAVLGVLGLAGAMTWVGVTVNIRPPRAVPAASTRAMPTPVASTTITIPKPAPPPSTSEVLELPADRPASRTFGPAPRTPTPRVSSTTSAAPPLSSASMAVRKLPSVLTSPE